jgi:hypothetical protein
MDDTKRLPPEFAHTALDLSNLGRGDPKGSPKVGKWMFIVEIACPCGKNFLWAGQPGKNGPGTQMICECRRLYTLANMPTWSEKGEIAVPILHTGVMPSPVIK